MEFLAWHYNEGLRFYAKRYLFALSSISHYFSLTLLLPTLFAPWKRLIVTEKQSGFNLAAAFTNFSFNFISRFMGAAVRITLFVVGVVAFMLLAVFGILGFVVWIVIPFLSLGVYGKFSKNPEFIAEKTFRKMNSGKPIPDFLRSKPGEFISAHLGIPEEKLEQAAKPVKFEASFHPKSMGEIVLELISQGVWPDMFFREHSVTGDDFVAAAKWWDKRMEETSVSLENPGFASPGIGLELLFGYTPLLNQYASEMGVKQEFSHHLIGRQDVVNRMQRVLTAGQSIILVGEPGVGKKTVIFEFARRAAAGELGEKLSYRRVMELDYNFVFSGTTDRDRKKQKLSGILEEASAAGNIILSIRDLHRITNIDFDGVDLTDVFEKQLERGKLKIIAVATPEDYEKYLAKSGRLSKYFEKVEVKEPNKEQAMEILLSSANDWERKKNVTITVPALRRVLEGSDQYITETPFPEKALELLDAVIFFHEQKGADKTITADDVNAVLSEKTGISFANLGKTETTKLTNLEETMHERLVNQNEAVSLISKILRSKTVGVVETNRPIGSFLFLGPTGVGKTETAKVLARVYFGSSDKILRFDMAEYAGAEGLERLIGSVSKNMPGALTTSIKNNPASLLLLDEIEKAPPQVYNLFLAMLDEGTITDAFDKKINCKNLFVIATSNAGSQYIHELVQNGQDQEDLNSKVVEYVLKQGMFSPELINRFDGVLVYKPLSRESLVKVARILLNELAEDVRAKNVNVEFSDEAIKKLVDDGFEPENGARPIRRLVELSIGDVIGKAILEGNVKPGDTITIIPGDGKGAFSWEKSA